MVRAVVHVQYGCMQRSNSSIQNGKRTQGKHKELISDQFSLETVKEKPPFPYESDYALRTTDGVWRGAPQDLPLFLFTASPKKYGNAIEMYLHL